jgi:hypothetical protein
MDKLADFRRIIKETLDGYAQRTYSNGKIRNYAVYDDTHDRYLVMSYGWEKLRRSHGCLIHVEIINGKIWIQRDGTESGVALDFTAAGISPQDIVIGYQPEIDRQYSGFALA